MIKKNIKSEDKAMAFRQLAYNLQNCPVNDIGRTFIAFLFLRRMDCLLLPYYEQVHKAFTYSKVDELSSYELTNGLSFYNNCGESLSDLLKSKENFTDRFDRWLNGFDIETKQTLNGLGFDRDLSLMKQSGAFFKVVESACDIDLTAPIDKEIVQKWLSVNISRATGEFFSPQEYGDIIAALMFQKGDIRVSANIFDPVCGSSIMLSTVAEIGLKQGFFENFECFGTDLNLGSVALSKALKLILGLDNLHIEVANALVKESFDGMKFDFAVADLPLGGRLSEHDIKDMSVSDAYVNGITSKVSPEIYFMQMIIHRLTGCGKAAVITAGGPLFNVQSVDVRSWLFSMDYVEAIVRLPKVKSAFTGLDRFVWILNKNKVQDNKQKVHLIDLQMMERYVPAHAIIPDELLFELANNENKNLFSKLIPTSDFATYNVTLQNSRYGGTIKTTISDSAKGLRELYNQGFDTSENGQWRVLYEKTTVEYTVTFNAFFALNTEILVSANDYHDEIKDSLYYAGKSLKEIEAIKIPPRANLDDDSACQKSQWAGKVPATWKHLSLQNVFECKPSTRQTFESGSRPLITIKSLRNREVIDFVEPTEKSVLVTDDDMLIIRTGQNAGEVYEGFDGVLGYMLYRMRFLDSANYYVDNKFASYMLKAMSKHFAHLAQGMAIPNLSAKVINSVVCYLPSFEEQQNIVKFLNPIVGRIEGIHSNLEVEIPKLIEFRDALIFDAVTGKLDI